MNPLKFWGWGREGDGLAAEEISALERAYAARLGITQFDAAPTPRAQDIQLRAPRLAIPANLARVCTTDHGERLIHSYGKSFFDSVRVFARDFSNPPDVVALPHNEQDVINVLDWATRANAIVIPFGAGSSVVGGIEPPRGDRPVVTLDLRHLDKVLEIDTTSEAARIQGGIYGPALEAGLKPSGLTLRHFPQSFEFSTLGGWIVTRSGGHFATLATHIDDLVESIHAVTPAGVMESRRLPGSGAGPSPDRLMIGSEGILGVVTEAWMRLRKRPTFRASTSVKFKDFYRAADCVRAISQAGLYPTNCRLVDATEAAITGGGDGAHHLLVLAFESADHPCDAWMKRALEIVADHGGDYDRAALASDAGNKEGSAGKWRDGFIRAPYFREHLTPRNVIVETFESAITWERLKDFHSNIKDATERAVKEATGHPGIVTCRFTHVYPDGPAPYFTFHARGTPGKMLEQCWHVKRAASDELMKQGGTITHHHAVGRDHRPWYDRQRPPLFSEALRAAKKALDPTGMLNPGVLIDP
jgi:alkyldihydroxyacetonephosphate synthase